VDVIYCLFVSSGQDGCEITHFMFAVETSLNNLRTEHLEGSKEE
jgi:hypothetical protein